MIVMKDWLKTLVVLIFCCSACAPALAQQAGKTETALFPIWNKSGKEGFIDAKGRVIIAPQFDKVKPFSEGLAAVMIGDKWGYIDRAGKVVINPRWKNNDGWFPAVSPFREGFAAVIEYSSWGVRDDSNYWTYKCGYIDKAGKYVIQPKMRQACGAFSDGLVLVELDFDDPEYPKGKGWYGYMDARGNWTAGPGFFSASHFKNGLALVSDDPTAKDFHLIDKTGRKVSDVKDCLWRYTFSEGLALVTSDKGSGYINEKCEPVFKLPMDIKTDAIHHFSVDYSSYTSYAQSAHFSEGLAVVYKQDSTGKKLFGYIDRAGKVVIPLQFTEAEPFSEGLAGVIVENNGQNYNAYINHKGETVIKNTRSISLFKNGLAYHHLALRTISERPNFRNIYGYMNKEGKYVWLSPDAEIHLSKEWIEKNFIGPIASPGP